MQKYLSDFKPWNRLNISRKRYSTLKPWKRLNLRKEVYETILEELPDHFFTEALMEGDAERLVSMIFKADG